MLKALKNDKITAAVGAAHSLQALVFLSFVLGGSARPEVVSLSPLRAIAALLLGVGLATLHWRHVKTYAPLTILAFACCLLPLSHLVPLPPGTANALPGHAVIATLDAQANLGAVWRPLTVTPEATRNALWSLLIPCAALALSIQIAQPRQKGVAVLVLAMGLISGVIGLLQTQSDSHGVLYFYETTNNGSAVGLFANRNHQAVFLACLFPLMVAALDLHRSGDAGVSRPDQGRTLMRQVKWAGAGGAALFLMLLILVTGSRAGLALGVFGLACTPFVAHVGTRSSRGTSPRTPRLVLAVSLVAMSVVVALAIWLRRAVAIERLLGTDAAADMRLRILPTVQEITQAFWPWGSGLGSFEKIYQVFEPANLLAPSYMNHAHNDWLELILTGGVPSLVLVALGVLIWLSCAVKLVFGRAADPLSPLRKAGLVIVLILALASLTDYPLRTPALSCLLVLASVWAAMPVQRPGDKPAADKGARS